MTSIKKFENFLTTKRIVPENRTTFYLTWVTQCLAFLDKSENDGITPEDIDRFLNHLSRFKEDWQIKQAKEAIGLYEYFKTNDVFQNPSVDMPADHQWKAAANQLTKVSQCRQGMGVAMGVSVEIIVH